MSETSGTPDASAAGTFDLDGETTVTRLGFGAMRLCGEDIIGRPDDEENAREVARRALELGVDFVDTADSYGPGVSERLLREADVPDDATVATKAGLLRAPEGDWLAHGDPDYIRNEALVSKDRLGVDTIDLYQFHRPDPDTDFEDSVTAFAELQDEGHVEHVGLSNVSVEQLDEAREQVDVATVQNSYNVTDREHQDVLDACEEYGIGFIPYFPIGGGEFDEVDDEIHDVADANDATPRQVALAWLLHQSDVTLPIPGTSSVDHLEENVAAAELSLSDDDVERLTDAV
ncbi:aldo/keto reductase [Candidatus Halobonum tyrrellensis]|uniref:Aldo/keto reductase n=1 Tax=Candidatus Halobonum tyrrellensis G22 TaxID=1324957 RepID=V4GPF4_9EURY|nr:aldo/keto reductase [Candidatus Halobonum tyrrellensis]ESP87261.1 aldo/keto reductase [Candidatus Halobonum tyrrellensis G22]